MGSRHSSEGVILNTLVKWQPHKKGTTASIDKVIYTFGIIYL